MLRSGWICWLISVKKNKLVPCHAQSLSCAQLFATPWTVACQAPLFMGFSRQEYWSGLPFPPPGDLPNPGIHPRSSARVGRFFTTKSEAAQSCPTLGHPMDCSLPGSSLHGILWEKVLEWVAISFSRGSSRPRDRTRVSRIPGRLFNLWATREGSPSLPLNHLGNPICTNLNSQFWQMACSIQVHWILLNH